MSPLIIERTGSALICCEQPIDWHSQPEWTSLTSALKVVLKHFHKFAGMGEEEMHTLPLSANGFQTIKCDPDQIVDDFFFLGLHKD